MSDMFMLVRVKLSDNFPTTVKPIAVSEHVGNIFGYISGLEWYLNAADVWVTDPINNMFYRIDTIVNLTGE